MVPAKRDRPMAENLESEAILNTRSIAVYLEDWYTDHIQGTDQKYKTFFTLKLAEEKESAPIEQKIIYKFPLLMILQKGCRGMACTKLKALIFYRSGERTRKFIPLASRPHELTFGPGWRLIAPAFGRVP